jgi:hypothetical protein
MRIRRGKLLTWGYIIAAGWFLAVAHARGAAINYASDAKADTTMYRTPEDMIEMVPILNKLPRTLNLGQGYLVNLSSDHLLINHRTSESQKAKAEPCSIGLSYSAPVAGSLSSQFNLPLFHATDLMASDWSRNPFGDYDVSMNRTTLDHPVLKIALSARF